MPYLECKYNWIDLIVVLATTTDLVCVLLGVNPRANATLTLIRQMSTLVPLRVIRLSLNLQLVFDALFKTIRSISSALVIGAVMIFILAVVGVNLLKG
jgi:hypothetical protein